MGAPSIGPAAEGRANPIIEPGSVPHIPLALPGHQLPAGGCRLVPCAGRPFPEPKGSWSQAHTRWPSQGRPDEWGLVREGSHLHSGHSIQGPFPCGWVSSEEALYPLRLDLLGQDCVSPHRPFPEHDCVFPLRLTYFVWQAHVSSFRPAPWGRAMSPAQTRGGGELQEHSRSTWWWGNHGKVKALPKVSSVGVQW